MSNSVAERRTELAIHASTKYVQGERVRYFENDDQGVVLLVINEVDRKGQPFTFYQIRWDDGEVDRCADASVLRKIVDINL